MRTTKFILRDSAPVNAWNLTHSRPEKFINEDRTNKIWSVIRELSLDGYIPLRDTFHLIYLRVTSAVDFSRREKCATVVDSNTTRSETYLPCCNARLNFRSNGQTSVNFWQKLRDQGISDCNQHKAKRLQQKCGQCLKKASRIGPRLTSNGLPLTNIARADVGEFVRRRMNVLWEKKK